MDYVSNEFKKIIIMLFKKSWMFLFVCVCVCVYAIFFKDCNAWKSLNLELDKSRMLTLCL